MVAFLLDTNVVSETIRRYPDPNVIRFLETAEEIFVPSGALLEIQMGIARATMIDPKRAVALSEWYNDLLKSDIAIVGTTQSVIDKWGTLLGDPRLLNLTVPRAGYKKPRGGQDLHIAAAALARRLVIATLNVDDFMLINSLYPLPGIYNPKEEKWYAKMQPLTEYQLPPPALGGSANSNDTVRRDLSFLKRQR